MQFLLHPHHLMLRVFLNQIHYLNLFNLYYQERDFFLQRPHHQLLLVLVSLG